MKNILKEIVEVFPGFSVQSIMKLGLFDDYTKNVLGISYTKSDISYEIALYLGYVTTLDIPIHQKRNYPVFGLDFIIRHIDSIDLNRLFLPGSPELDDPSFKDIFFSQPGIKYCTDSISRFLQGYKYFQIGDYEEIEEIMNNLNIGGRVYISYNISLNSHLSKEFIRYYSFKYPLGAYFVNSAFNYGSLFSIYHDIPSDVVDMVYSNGVKNLSLLFMIAKNYRLSEIQLNSLFLCLISYDLQDPPESVLFDLKEILQFQNPPKDYIKSKLLLFKPKSTISNILVEYSLPSQKP